MTRMHGLFIPDIEYLTDITALFTYLGEKVGVGHVCLVCNERGRAFRSTDAVQKHMLAKSHCRLNYDSYQEELAAFYDFRASYPQAAAAAAGDDEGSDWEDASAASSDTESELDVDSAVRVAESGYEIMLPSGGRAGHRSLAQYYKQRPRVQDARTALVVNSLMLEYKERGWAVAKMQPQQVRDQRVAREHAQRLHVAMGLKGNKLYRRMHISTADC
jgi:pre-60S factor REI1